MILSCNSCEKKFVVPDNAIGPEGRLVQCSSCGNKWKQFPINKKTAEKEKKETKQVIKKKTKKTKKINQKQKKRTGPDLYSPEYLAKKHGIKINSNIEAENKISKNDKKVTFGFYNTIIVYTILLVAIIRLLYFSQNFLIDNFPITENYLRYLFETIRNIKDIIENFIYGY